MNWTGRIFLGFLGSTLMRLVDIAMFVAIYIYVANHPAEIGAYKQWVMESFKAIAIYYKWVDPTTFAGQSILQLIGVASDFISSWPIFFGIRIALGIILTQIFWPWRKKATTVATTTTPKSNPASFQQKLILAFFFIGLALAGVYLGFEDFLNNHYPLGLVVLTVDAIIAFAYLGLIFSQMRKAHKAKS